jgi:hypothetical protein
MHPCRGRRAPRRHDGVTAHRNRETRAAQAALLRRCRAALAQWHRLHLASVRIGEAQQAGLADGDLFAADMRAARRLIEMADTLCADITKLETT